MKRVLSTWSFVLCAGVFACLASRAQAADAPASPIDVQNVAAGSANFQFEGVHTTINVSDNAIINYHRFDIPQDHQVQFVQPGAGSRVLNRVNAQVPSLIDGSLSANGQVFLVNPAGVIFGQSAVINVGQLFAAAGQLTDADFLAGQNRFVMGDAQMINQGTIFGEHGVHLMGSTVHNLGFIHAPQGVVSLTSGQEVFLREEGQDMMVNVDHLDALTGLAQNPSINNTDAGVTNDGQVTGQDVFFAVGDVYSLALVNNGQIAAKNVTLAGNSQVVHTGSMDVSNPDGQGGTAKVLGEKVAITGDIDASGAQGGGDILLGGGAGLRMANDTLVDEDARVFAHSTDPTSPHGNILIYSQETLVVRGNISNDPQNNAPASALASESTQRLIADEVAGNHPAAQGGSILLHTHGQLTIEQEGQIQAHASDLTLIGNNLQADPLSMRGQGQLLIHPVDPASSVGIGPGAPGDFHIDPADFADGFDHITLGNPLHGAHAIHIGTAQGQTITFTDPVTFAAPQPGGEIFVLAKLMGMDNASFTFLGSGNTTTLGADIITAANPITFNDAVILANDVNVDTTQGGTHALGANVAFNGNLNSTNANQDLVLSSGHTGDANFNANVGSEQPLGDVLIVNANDVNANPTFAAASLTQADGTGNTTFSDLITSTGTANINTAGAVNVSVRTPGPSAASLAAASTVASQNAGADDTHNESQLTPAQANAVKATRALLQLSDQTPINPLQAQQFIRAYRQLIPNDQLAPFQARLAQAFDRAQQQDDPAKVPFDADRWVATLAETDRPTARQLAQMHAMLNLVDTLGLDMEQADTARTALLEHLRPQAIPSLIFENAIRASKADPATPNQPLALPAA